MTDYTLLCVLIGALVLPACIGAAAPHAADAPVRFDPACVVVESGQVRPRAAHPHAHHPYPRSPGYPPRAIRDRVSGTVDVRVQVSADGEVSAVEIVGADPTGYFEEAALRSVQQRTFEPYAVDGTPVCVTFVQKVDFRFADQQ